MIVVSDTSPLNYLVLIEQEGILRKLFGRVGESARLGKQSSRLD